jgi:bacillithiol system protein YtxJ
MGLLNSIFGSNMNEQKKELFNWVALTESSQLEEIKRLSNSKLVVVFKHSTRCGISSGVFSQFEKTIDSTNNEVVFYYLDLLRYRNISNEISQVFNVYHQSPQLIVIKNEKAIANYSHYDIISSFNLRNFI